MAGSTSVSPTGSSNSSNIQSSSRSSNNGYGYGYGHGDDEPQPSQQIRFRRLKPSKRYVVSLCTESNSGTLSKVIVAEAEVHAEAPLVRLSYVVSCSALKQQNGCPLALSWRDWGLGGYRPLWFVNPNYQRKKEGDRCGRTDLPTSVSFLCRNHGLLAF